jgi:hypothetical protein
MMVGCARPEQSAPQSEATDVAPIPNTQQGSPKMSSTKIIAIVLIVAGVLGLAYGKFSYTKETHDAKVGPLELSVKDKETVNVPVWAGVGAIVIGAGILLAGGKRA